MIDLTIDEKQLERTVQRAREKNIVIPLFREQKNPETIPSEIKKALKDIELWAIDSFNLFRITWKNEPVEFGGGFDGVNFLEISPELSNGRP
jgi:cysteine synthase A